MTEDFDTARNEIDSRNHLEIENQNEARMRLSMSGGSGYTKAGLSGQVTAYAQRK